MGPKEDNDSSKVKRKNTNIMIDVKKEIIAKHENGVRVSDLATQFGMAKSTICTIPKNRETIKKANVARGVTVITKQRSQTIEEEVKNLCTKYCYKSLNKQLSGVQERINPFYINSYGENSFGLRTFWFTNDLELFAGARGSLVAMRKEVFQIHLELSIVT